MRSPATLLGVKRRVGTVAAALVVALGFTACGDVPPTADPSSTTPATDYVTYPPPTTTTPPTTTLPPQPGDVIFHESQYVTVAGDFPFNVAYRFGVDFDEFVALNGWTTENGEVPDWPPSGTTIRIPAGAIIPNETGPGATLITLVPNTTLPPPPPSIDPTASVEPGTSAAPTGCDTYTVQEGDVPLNVASDLGVTVDALDAANEDTDGYGAFYVGLEIVVPC
jgi:hypothetical protein